MEADRKGGQAASSTDIPPHKSEGPTASPVLSWGAQKTEEGSYAAMPLTKEERPGQAQPCADPGAGTGPSGPSRQREEVVAFTGMIP